MEDARAISVQKWLLTIESVSLSTNRHTEATELLIAVGFAAIAYATNHLKIIYIIQ